MADRHHHTDVTQHGHCPSGHKTTATFEVHTTDSSGKPTATVVKLTDENQWGVLVSGEVTAGKPASVTVPAGKLKNGVTYAVRSSGYDATSNVYESDWSPYSTFKINVPRPRSRTSPSRHHRPRPASTHLRRLRSNSRVPIPARSRDCAAMTTAGNAPPRTPRGGRCASKSVVTRRLPKTRRSPRER
uniref:Uncharacterized protein n=1 Tax=Streptomyces avermitilis TaxID=33903 RepID=A0A499VEN8_STRAX|nr:hypothetical protein SAVMC3_00380 [Streptomyces avermitilis]